LLMPASRNPMTASHASKEKSLHSDQRDGQVAIVTGASSGIGRALAVRLGSEGFRVGLIARRGELLDAQAREIAAAGGMAAAAVADVGDRDALRNAIGRIENQLGPADVMVANAGFGAPTRLDPLNIDDVERTFRVNLMGVIYSIEAVLPGMLARRRGQLLAVSSLAGDKGLPGESAYCASKAAVNVYMEGMRIALRKRGIVVTTVCPGFVETPMAPMDAAAMPFVMSAEAAAARIARLIARRRGGVHRFPRRMAMLMAMVARLPDGLVARLVRDEGETHPTPPEPPR
jgi:short-subunit dehydrogenase